MNDIFDLSENKKWNINTILMALYTEQFEIVHEYLKLYEKGHINLHELVIHLVESRHLRLRFLQLRREFMDALEASLSGKTTPEQFQPTPATVAECVDNSTALDGQKEE